MPNGFIAEPCTKTAKPFKLQKYFMNEPKKSFVSSPVRKDKQIFVKLLTGAWSLFLFMSKPTANMFVSGNVPFTNILLF